LADTLEELNLFEGEQSQNPGEIIVIPVAIKPENNSTQEEVNTDDHKGEEKSDS